MKTNVYSLVLGIIISICSLSVSAQGYQYIPIVKPGFQIWTEFHGNLFPDVTYSRFALSNEDTLINQFTYKKLYVFTDSVFNPLNAECVGGIREDSLRKVFYKGKNIYPTQAEGLLYDFSLIVGDTFACPYLGADYNYKVLSVDTVEIFQIKRRQIIIGLSYANTGEIIHSSTAKWIEGIGCDQGLLIDIFYNFTSLAYTGMLRCYEYDGELQYHYGTEGCSDYLSINSVEKDKAEIYVYPNPAKDDISFSCSFMIKDIEIYDIMGRRVLKTEVKDYSKTINISSFVKGSYVAKLNTEQGLVSKKFIVE